MLYQKNVTRKAIVILRNTLLCAFLTLTLSTGCDTLSPEEGETVDPTATLTEYIQSVPTTGPSTPDNEPKHNFIGSGDSFEINNGGIICETDKFSASFNRSGSNIPFLSLSGLYAGMVIRGDDYHRGIFNTVGLSLGERRIFIDGTGTSVQVNDPSVPSELSAALSELRKQGPLPQFKLPFYRKVNAYSVEQVALDLGLKFGLPDVFGLNGSLSKRDTVNLNTVVMTAMLERETISVNDPTDPAGVFDPTVTTELASSKMGNNPMAYIASVRYGVYVFISVTSRYEHHEIQGALDATISFLDFGTNLDIKSRQILQESEVRINVLGGSAEHVINHLIDGLNFPEFLRQTISAGADTPVVPISYTVKWLKDNSLAHVALATEYERPTCRVNAQKVRIGFEDIVINKDCDGSNSPGEFYYQFGFQANEEDPVILAEVDLSDPRTYPKRKSGEVINLDTNDIFLVDKSEISRFTVSGWVQEWDNNDSPDEFVGEFEDNYYFNDWETTTRTKTLTESNTCEVEVTYNVELLD